MKITEISNESRKIIKQLQNLYISYSLNTHAYNELINYMSRISNTIDQDILREIAIIRVKLYNEVIALLRKSHE